MPGVCVVRAGICPAMALCVQGEDRQQALAAIGALLWERSKLSKVGFHGKCSLLRDRVVARSRFTSRGMPLDRDSLTLRMSPHCAADHGDKIRF